MWNLSYTPINKHIFISAEIKTEYEYEIDSKGHVFHGFVYPDVAEDDKVFASGENQASEYLQISLVANTPSVVGIYLIVPIVDYICQWRKPSIRVPTDITWL